MKNSDVQKYKKFISGLASKRGGVNNIVLQEDLEQELWCKLARNWNNKSKSSGKSLADLGTDDCKKLITVIFKNMTKDIVRKYVSRLDTYQNAKFSYVVGDSTEEELVNKLAYSSEESTVGLFSHSPSDPLERLECCDLLEDIDDWSDDLEDSDKEIVEAFVAMTEELELKCRENYPEAKRKIFPHYVIAQSLQVKPSRVGEVLNELRSFIEFREGKEKKFG